MTKLLGTVGGHSLGRGILTRGYSLPNSLPNLKLHFSLANECSVVSSEEESMRLYLFCGAIVSMS